jgi:hypothetical protein
LLSTRAFGPVGALGGLALVAPYRDISLHEVRASIERTQGASTEPR